MPNWDHVASRKWRAPPLQSGRSILLFFESTEVDRLLPGDRFLRRMLKDQCRRLQGRRRVLGVQRAFRQLAGSLIAQGYDVRINERRTALANPDYPIGLSGWPHVLQYWNLPNPAVLGPGLFDHPGQAPELMSDPRYRRYMVGSEWVMDLFRPYYGDTLFEWFAGIDTTAWPDTLSHPKTTDFLVYAKFLWDPKAGDRTLLEPLLRKLEARGLTHRIIRYGAHNQLQYFDLLKQSRNLLFLCEHETQGIAVQEAMACGLPVLAWDAGQWLDPVRLQYSLADVPASSVPYFSPICGERFRTLDDFDGVLEQFLGRRGNYEPRRFVLETLSMERSAAIYVDEYFGLLPQNEAVSRQHRRGGDLTRQSAVAAAE